MLCVLITLSIVGKQADEVLFLPQLVKIHCLPKLVFDMHVKCGVVIRIHDLGIDCCRTLHYNNAL